MGPHGLINTCPAAKPQISISLYRSYDQLDEVSMETHDIIPIAQLLFFSVSSIHGSGVEMIAITHLGLDSDFDLQNVDYSQFLNLDFTCEGHEKSLSDCKSRLSDQCKSLCKKQIQNTNPQSLVI